MKVLSVVGARPNFMKVGPIHRALVAAGEHSVVLHTGQHYDERMSDVFFRQLGLPEPDHYLGLGGGSHAVQTARVMEAFEPILLEEDPDVVLVVGDVNSTVATTLVATKLHYPVVHVEAGLRSFDRGMPEEINRMCTDAIADLLFVTERSGLENLANEGVPDSRVRFVGNVMIDSLVHARDAARETDVAGGLGLDRFALMTMHRPSNVDTEASLRQIVRLAERVAEHLPIVLPLHPRTSTNMARFGLLETFRAIPDLHLIEPAGYLEFLGMMDRAVIVVTDSGGIQEETTFLGVPCITLRTSTERPITVEEGTNELMELDPEAVAARVRERLDTPAKGRIPELWDGQAAGRIVADLQEWVHADVLAS